jgi:hypothetical protein
MTISFRFANMAAPEASAATLFAAAELVPLHQLLYPEFGLLAANEGTMRWIASGFNVQEVSFRMALR